MPIIGNFSSAGKKPATPTIGTASDGGTGTTASVAFTPSSYIGKGTITYTATSSPGSLTGTGSGSPITVSGLTTGTAYTFTVAGTTNYGVSSDSSAASNSVTPANPSSYESIATLTPSTGTTTVSFTSIPSTYKHLQIRAIVKNNEVTNSLRTLLVRANSDTATNYTGHYWFGNGAGGSGGLATSGGGFDPAMYQTFAVCCNGAAQTNVFASSIIDIFDYASTSKYKTSRMIGGCANNVSSTTYGITAQNAMWRSTAAISTLTFTIDVGAFQSGTRIALYGIKG